MRCKFIAKATLAITAFIVNHLLAAGVCMRFSTMSFKSWWACPSPPANVEQHALPRMSAIIAPIAATASTARQATTTAEADTTAAAIAIAIAAADTAAAIAIVNADKETTSINDAADTNRFPLPP
eukprot:5867078-Pyramimonas_sp.AAC.1